MTKQPPNKAITLGAAANKIDTQQTLGHLLKQLATHHPEHGVTYVNSQGGEQFVSYPCLLLQAQRHLHGLLNQGIQKGDIVMIQVSDLESFYSVLWACLIGGIILAPVTQPDAFAGESDKLSKLINIWRNLHQPRIIIQEKHQNHYLSMAQQNHLHELQLVTTESLANTTPHRPTSDLLPADIAMIQFSSGSTGHPKGVSLSHQNILSNIMALRNRLELTHNDVTFSWLPHTHDMGIFCQYLTSIAAGCNMVLFTPPTFVRSPHLFLSKISTHGGTWFGCPNFGFAWMTKKVTDAQLESLDLTSLRFVINGAEPISAKTVDEFITKFSACGAHQTLMRPAYGMAEATVAVCVSPFGEKAKLEPINRQKLIHHGKAVRARADDQSIHFFHVGKPVEGMSIRIVDTQGQIVNDRVIGEIQIKGQSVTQGYYNHHAANQQLFQNGWLKTGDLGFIDQGSLVVTGRIKDIIFLNGMNYYAHDLEETIDAHTDIPRGHITFIGLVSHGKEQLLAFIKHKKLNEKFYSKRTMIIETIGRVFALSIDHVIPLPAIPRTTSGKLKRFYLERKFIHGDYNHILSNIDEAIKPQKQKTHGDKDNQSPIGRFVKQAWSNVLGIEIEALSEHDHFLQLGGNSIKAYDMLTQLEQLMQVSIGIDMLIQCKTIQEITHYLEQHRSHVDKPNAIATSNRQTKNEIAITGYAFRLPSASNHEAFWNILHQGLNTVRQVSKERQHLSGHPHWNDWMAELKDIDQFDNHFFGISDQDAAFMDPQQRLSLEVAHEALDDAGLMPGLTDRRRIGVYSGVSANTYYQLITDHIRRHPNDPIPHNTLISNLSNMVAAHISHAFNFSGPSLNIDTACSSFLVALHHATQAIHHDKLEAALVVGSNLLATPTVHHLSRNAGILSSTDTTKVFDAEADGSTLGEGIVVFCLEPLSKAARERKQIHGVVLGSAINNDGESFSIMAPNPKGQYEAITQAYRDANRSPSDIDYIELHGSGTAIGDPIEMNVLQKVFNDQPDNDIRSPSKKVGIGSVKCNIGHLLPAASGASLAKVLLCFKHQCLAPNTNHRHVNPALRLEQSPFSIVEQPRPWHTEPGKRRHAAISAFGLGGTNAHVILSDWHADTQSNKPTNQTTLHILTCSAKSPQSLAIIMEQTVQLIASHSEIHISDLCYTRNRFRHHHAYRAACIVSTNQRTATEWSTHEQPCRTKQTLYINLANPSGMAHQSTSDTRATFCRLKYAINQLQPIIANPIQITNTTTIDQPSKDNNAVVVISYGTINNPSTLKPHDQKTILTLKNIDEQSDDQLPLYLMQQLYCFGVDFHWDQVYPDGSAKLIALPAYPFQRQSFWITNHAHAHKEDHTIE